MVKQVFIILSAILLSFNVLAEETLIDNTLPKIEEGKQYVTLPKYPSPDKEVIELFSFNCPSCFRLEMEFKGPKTIKDNLPKDVRFKRYSLNNFGPLSPELSEAWAIANVLGIADEVSVELYNGIQRDRTIKTADDIKAVFVNLGVDDAKYESMKNSFLVKVFMSQQEEAIKDLKPSSIPSFYVNGKYLINSAGLDQSSDQGTIQDYSRVANFLVELK